MDISRHDSEEIKIWLSAAAVLLALCWPWLSRRWARGARATLVALTVVAGLNYARWGPHLPFENVDSYDVIHYYLGSKYFAQFGYHDLYPALLLIDNENGPHSRKLRHYRAQDRERGYLPRTPLSDGLARGRELRAKHFTQDSWAQLEREFLMLQRGPPYSMDPRLWRTMMNDRGFNGTPVWLLLAQPLAQAVPIEAIKALCSLDALLLAGALVAVGFTYGGNVALWTLLFLFLSYSLRWPVVSWAFLRYDWVAALLLAMVLLKRARPFWAGVLTAYASLVRFFPAAWMFGPATQGLMRLLRAELPARKRFDRRLLQLAAGFVVGLAVLEGAALLRYGYEAVSTHATNIVHHIKPEELSSRRVGFALAYAFDGSLKPRNLPHAEKLEIKREAPQRLVIAALVLALLGFGLRNRPHDEAFGFGVIPFFMLATASYYYYVARVTLIVLHAADLSRVRNRVGLAWLLSLEVFANAAETIYPGHRVFLIGFLSWGLTAYCVGMASWLAAEAWPRDANDQDAASSRAMASDGR